MPGLIPGIQFLHRIARKTWKAGTSPAITMRPDYQKPNWRRTSPQMAKWRPDFGLSVDLDSVAGIHLTQIIRTKIHNLIVFAASEPFQISFVRPEKLNNQGMQMPHASDPQSEPHVQDKDNDPKPAKGTNEPWKRPGHKSQNPDEADAPKPDLERWNDAHTH